MVNVINFSESLEHDLRELSTEVQEKRAAAESTPLTERMAVRESIRSLRERVEALPQEQGPQPVPPIPPSTAAASAATDSPLPSYLDEPNVNLDVKRAVEDLIAVTFRDGLMHGLREAKKSAPFIEDAFHDALVEKLVPELKRRGLLK
jgi:hypothetical protein